MESVIETRSGGIKCDNSKCDYKDESVGFDDYKNWLNRPCPDCGDNLLTEADFIAVNQLMSLAGLINENPVLVGIDPAAPNGEKSVTIRTSFDGSGIPSFDIVNE